MGFSRQEYWSGSPLPSPDNLLEYFKELCVLSCVQLFVTPWTVACQAPLSLGFSSVQFSSVQLLRHVQLFATPWTAAGQTSLSITNSQSLLKLMSIEFVMPSSHLILCRLLLLLPSILPSIRVFSSESVLCIRWPRYQSFSISPSNDYSGLISFKIN